MGDFKLSLWKRGTGKKSKPLGKSYELKDGQLAKGEPCVNAARMEVIEFCGLAGLASCISKSMPGGAAFMTSGIPRDLNIMSAPVTIKDIPKEAHISRTQDDIQWRPGSGTYFPIDYDPGWAPNDTLSVEGIRQTLINALAVAGVDASELRMLTYWSSSSGFTRTSDDHSFDKGGRHLIFLVQDAGNLKRFRESLLVFMALTGSCYGAVSESGHFLQRGVIDLMAISPTQPTFAGVPAYEQDGLTNVREDEVVSFLGGDMEALDTRTVRDPTSRELDAYSAFWAKGKARLKPEMDRKKREWLDERGQELKERLPDASPEQIRTILEHRWSGNLVSSDVIILGGKPVTISEILLKPEKYDGATGPDPIDPEYQGGAQKCKVYLNRGNGRPMVFSQAHWGMKYRLWFDVSCVLNHLGSMDIGQAQNSVRYVLQATRVTDEPELQYFFNQLATLLKTTKKSLMGEYAKKLRDNMQAASSFDPHGELTTLTAPEPVNDIAHQAALTLISREREIHTDDSDVWRYIGTHFAPVSELFLKQQLRQILIEEGWESATGLGSTTKQAHDAVKELTYTPLPIIAGEPKRILNFMNGELHFLSGGAVDFRPHDPSSRLTHVIPVKYDPGAKAPIFQQTLDELFYPPAYKRLKQRSPEEREEYEEEYRSRAAEMREYLEEVLAYMIIPDRWIPAWFLWIGDGHNGKTFLVNILYLILDEKAIESDRLKAIASDNFGMERLIGKTLFVDDDLDTNTTIPDGFVKKLSENKLLSANRKNKTSLTFMNRSALLLLANNYPRLIDLSAGTTRRIHAIVFPHRFYSPEEIEAMADGTGKDFAKDDLADPHRIRKIREKLPGVINILATAYQRLIKRGGFSLPDPVKAANERVLLEGNPLPQFIKQCCETGPEFKVKTSSFAANLKYWANGQRLHWHPSNLQVRTMMGHLGWGGDKVKKINGHDHYIGISPLESSWDDEW